MVFVLIVRKCDSTLLVMLRFPVSSVSSEYSPQCMSAVLEGN